jgi:ribulose-5-phosphate 4-epimerase/fuculose-1-phosphate aldolase
MSITTVVTTEAIRDQVSAEEWQARVELAAGHRVLAHYGVNDMTYNHFSLRVPGAPQHMLIKRSDYMFEEVTASSLLTYSLDGRPVVPEDAPPLRGGGLVIHAGLLKARPNFDSILHTHTPAAMGVSAHRHGLLPITQHAMRFYGDMHYHDFKGFEFDLEMTDRLLHDLEDGYVMLLRNHGALVCGSSVAACVVTHHFLEMACQGQIAALSAGEGNYVLPDKEACEYAHQQAVQGGNFLSGAKDWRACLRLAERLDPSYRQ